MNLILNQSKCSYTYQVFLAIHVYLKKIYSITFKYLRQSDNKVNKNRIHGKIWAFYSFVAVKHVHLLLQRPKQSHKFSN